MFLFALLGALIFRPGIVDWDGAAHYAYLRSAVLDRDLDFANDLVPVEAQQRTVTGRVADSAPVGAALVWTPWFLAADGVCRLIGVFALCWEGYGWLYVTAVSLGTALYGWAGLLMAQRYAAHVTSLGSAWAATLAVWLASPLLAYMVVVPSMPHAIAFAATSAFVACWPAVRQRPRLAVWLGWGMLGGLAALLRWQSAVWLVLPAFELLTARDPLWPRVRRAVALACGFVLAFSPQMTAWVILFGTPLAVPQGDGFLLWARPEVAAVLFSPLHGLVSWMPLALVCLLGLARLFVVRKDIALPLAVVLALYVYVNSIVLDWWAGGAFGPRRFIDAFPIMIVGLSALFDWLRARLRLALVALCVLCAAGQWLFMAEFYSARVLPGEPLTWASALARVPELSAAQWLILPSIVGQWHMGPFGTPASSMTYLVVFAAGGYVVWLAVTRLRLSMRMMRWIVALAACAVLGVDLFLLTIS
ncbi:MAG: hypothetical protein HZB53_12385 [Chloroflexi bacterium]|nr:hypothetical protein [Chloroflexota bacterium]